MNWLYPRTSKRKEDFMVVVRIKATETTRSCSGKPSMKEGQNTMHVKVRCGGKDGRALGGHATKGES